MDPDIAVARAGGGGRAWHAHPRWFVLLASFALAGIPLTAVRAVPLTAEYVIFALLVVYAVCGSGHAFAWAWAPWLATVVALDDLRGLQAVGPAPHAAAVARFERWMFGGSLPVLELQRVWASAAGLRVHDVVLSAVYLLHSPAPLLCGAALWAWRRDLFLPYVASLIAVATAGLLTYLAFPESPPWLAADDGVIPAVRRIASEVMSHAGPLAGVYSGADPLPNAAMPSLHVSYPLIVAWWTLRAFGRRAAWIVLYPACVCVGVVYLGEHWVIDVLAGAGYAGGGIVLGPRLLDALRRRPGRTRLHSET